jgi:hypothetical protein
VLEVGGTKVRILAAHVDDYTDFAVTTAKEIVKEEDERLRAEIIAEVSELMDVWLARIGARIVARMEEVGIAQILEILGEWEEDHLPTFKYKGATDTGLAHE